ncbi:hypothetical protein [Colwellia piezophila]|uniref:hypothetical protein n=1 Tax=Colwellia piezophila TaxID=211668 RepID=UPI0003721638|nr:hypothetical protein [Colwellia piezophila]
MLEFLEHIATKLQPFRKLSYLVAVFLGGVIANQLLQTSSPTQASNTLAILSFVGCLWLLLFNVLLSTFHNIPSKSNSSHNLFVRLKAKLQRAPYYVLALLFIALTLVIAFLSIRMLRV